MNKSFKWVAGLLVLLGIMLAAFAFISAKPKVVKAVPTASQAPAAPQHTMVVLSKDVVAGHVLQAEDVRMQAVEQLPAGAYIDSTAVIGRGTAQALSAGAPVTTKTLLSGISGMLQAGERAVSIKVDEASAVGHKVQPGDWVDVFLVLRRDNQEVGETQARLLLARKRVLAYGAELDKAGQAQPQTEKGKGDQPAQAEGGKNPQPAKTAVIAVQVEEVNRLMLAEIQGQILLALRSPLDETLPTTAAMEKVPGMTISPKLLVGDEVQLTAVPINSALTPTTLDTLAAAEAGSKTKPKPAAAAPVARTGGSAAPVRSQPAGTTVEFIKGARTETVRY